MSSPSDNSPSLAKPRRSLRFELLASQLSLLLLVVGGFGGTVYFLIRQSVFHEAESDLLGAAQLIAQDLRERPPEDIKINRTYLHRFGPAPRDHAYMAIWDADGHLIADDEPLPPHVVRPDEPPPVDGPHPFISRPHGGELDVIVRGPRGTDVLVGRALAKEGDRLLSWLRNIILAGGFILLLGAAAAWKIANRIVRPLEAMSDTATTISANRLDQRLDPTTGTAELTHLATVFNGMLDRLQASFQQQVRFTADASHELRTPVSIILTQTDHALSQPRSPDDYRGALETCLRAARRMKQLVDDLMLLAHADSGRLEARREPCDLADTARSSARLLEPLANERQVQLISHLQPTPVLCDPAQLAQVVTNLLSNAINHSPAAGHTSLSVYPSGERAILTVADDGAGISPDDQKRIFERFYQADESRSRQRGQGSGLGLAIVAEILAAHQGAIEVSSQPGEGSTFTVTLPLRKGETAS